ncbi:MAG: M91 family zinc metallopeptidase [Segniliparus sp.]|uniref:M91 family zinc metallopeptidase n=1 Tax=Segniliparus sp. TaxID=2804064 RepID=UPI003F30965F
MATTFQEDRDWDIAAGHSLAQAAARRADGLSTHGAAMRERRPALRAWTGSGAEAAGEALDRNQAHTDSARHAAAALAAALGRIVDGRSQLKAEISNIVEDGARMRFTIADDGTVGDFYGPSGLWTELPEDERALYLRLKSELPARIAHAVAQGDVLDDEASAALAHAAGLTAPTASGPGQAQVEDLGDGVVVTSDQSQGMVFVNTGDGDSAIDVAQDAQGRVTITVNGQSRTLSGRQAKSIEIDSGRGNDTITVSPDVTVRLRLVDAGGNNTIDEKASGGAYIQTGDGDNTVSLGDGHNYVYLGAGANRVTGTTGADYVNGGTGKNTINAGSGPSVLYGGTGRSTINAGTGASTIYTGSGDITVNNQGGQDAVYAQAGSHINADPNGAGKNTVVTVATTNIPDSIAVSGTPEFRERVLADLQLLASSPAGQHMLAGLGNSGHTLDISNGESWNSADHGKPVRNNSFTWMSDDNGDYLAKDPKTEFADPKAGAHGQGHNAIVAFDPTLTALGDPAQGARQDYHETPPTVVLFHELAHAYDFANGTMAPGYYGPNGTDRVDGQLVGASTYLRNAEREAVGLPFNWDGESSTPETYIPDSVHPHDLTENGLREEMGLPDRQHYLG